ncbi:MAG: glycosyltransferase, partial [Planctomycetes bacterium]|jgi:glycosyltransferase involved in cell wall biosynthesis|nr:glycosyltransferase [Planctomycetota bacterium]
VRREAKRLGFYDDGRRPLLWLNPYHADHMIGRMHEAAVIYDITDDWSQFGRNRRVQRRIAEQDRRVCEKADAVIVCSEGLAASKCQYGAKLHLIKNGVDCRHYAAVCDVHGELPDEARTWDKPVLGYTGTIHRDRLDVALVEQIARRLDRGTIVLIGPSHLNPQERRALKATGRVVITGAVPYAQLPEHMRAFDVCIVPHRVTPFTDSLNPIKLWEYLAAGKPIVSTPVAGFRDYPQHVRLATDAASFVAQAFDALSEEDDRAAARRAEAERHAWTRRVDQVEGVLDAAASRSATTRSR